MTTITATTKTTNWVLAWFILIVLALIWGTSFFLIKQGLKVYSPLQVAALRVSAAFFALLPLAIFSLRKVPRERLKFIFLSGLLGILLPAVLFGIAQQHIASSVAGVMNSSTPALTFLIAFLFFKQAISLRKIIGLLLGVVGSIGLTFSAKSGSLEFNGYALLVMIATLLYAINVNMVATYLKSTKPLHTSSLSLFLIAPFALTYLLMADIPQTYQKNIGQFWYEGSFIALLAIISLGLFSTAFATIMFNYLLQMTSAVFASTVTYLIPLVAIFWGIVDGETLSLSHYIGIICIITGVYLINKRSKPL